MIDALKLTTTAFLKKIRTRSKKLKEKLQLTIVKITSVNLHPRAQLPAYHHPYSNISSHCSRKKSSTLQAHIVILLSILSIHTKNFTRFYKMIVMTQCELGCSKYKTVMLVRLTVLFSFVGECQFLFVTFYMICYYYLYCLSLRDILYFFFSRMSFFFHLFPYITVTYDRFFHYFSHIDFLLYYVCL